MHKEKGYGVLIIIVIAFSAIAALFWNSFIPKLYVSCIATVVTVLPLIWLIGQSHIGGFGSKVFLGNVITISVISLCVSILVGLLLRKIRADD